MRHGSPEHGRPGHRADSDRRRAAAIAGAVAGPARYAQLPYACVLVGIAVGLGVISRGVHLVPSGTLVLGGVLLLAALARLTLPERQAGLLSVRRRALDVAILGVLGIGLLVAGFVVPVPR